MTLIPRCLRYASPPTKVLFSPITTRATLYRTHAPVHISHGDKEVYMLDRNVAVSIAFLRTCFDPWNVSRHSRVTPQDSKFSLTEEIATWKIRTLHLYTLKLEAFQYFPALKFLPLSDRSPSELAFSLECRKGLHGE